MADEFQIGSGNWWDSSRINSGSSTAPLSSIGSFGWATEMADMKARSSMDSAGSVVSGSSNVFQDTQKLQGPHHSAGDGGLADSNLQMMGLGLSSQAMDWSQSLLRSGKGESRFGSLLQEADLSSNTNYQQESGMPSSQEQWRSQKIFSGRCEDSSIEFKQINRGLSSHIISSGGDSTSTSVTVTTCQQDSGHVYGSPASTMLQGLVVGSDNQHPQQSTFDNGLMNNYQYPPNYVYAMNSGDQQLPSWSKYPQFIRNSPPPHSQLHFSSNAAFWNASSADVRSTVFPSLQTQFPFDEKPKNTSEVGDLGTVAKKSGSEPSTKRPRNETTSPLPAFKVRKEKMGDRITALQQLVSPFGKTDTASVLSEAIEYIKFLHDQVGVLSTPYMKSGAPIQHQQRTEKSKDPEGPKQDLRSRGLCLVPVSSTFPVTHETTVDFWTPTFGGTFR